MAQETGTRAGKKATTVRILGVEYRLRGNIDQDFADTVARYVDDRMREIARRQQTASQTQVAVLALLNVSGELLRERERRQAQEREQLGHVQQLGDRIEAFLAESTG